jgi:hypothetical protein
MLDSVANLVKVNVSQGYDQNDTSIVLAAGQGANLIAAAPFNVTWWNATDYADPSDDPNAEIVRITAISTDTLTITRGAESATGGGAASTKNAGGKTYKMILGITAKMITDINANLQKPWRLVNLIGNIDGVNTVYTLEGDIAPFDANSLNVSLAQQGQIQNIHYTFSGVTVTYTTPPPASLDGEPHVAQYQ